MNGLTVKALRKQAGLSRAALAEKVGITPVHLWRLETNKVENPGHSTVVNIATALGVAPEQLDKPIAA